MTHELSSNGLPPLRVACLWLVQSFPLKTNAFPKLVEGAYGGAESALHYDADDVAAIVAYAKDRGLPRSRLQ